MKDKYLGEDGIKEKYNFREQCINGAQKIGMFGGLGFSAAKVCYDFWTGNKLNMTDFKYVIGGFGIGVISYLLGDYLDKRNGKKKEKALKNVEARLLVEERK